MLLRKNNSLLFIGDSITDCDRARPAGTKDGLGNGYVNLINSFLWVKHPELRIRIINSGISGNRITDLSDRWAEDVMEFKPDWVSIMIGINDVWRQFDDIAGNGQVSLKLFKETYIKLIEKTQKREVRLILMAPFYLELNLNDPMRKMMDDYGRVVEELSRAYETLFINTQMGFDNYLAHNPTQTLCGDRVHPNQIGHMIIADCFLKGIGF